MLRSKAIQIIVEQFKTLKNYSKSWDKQNYPQYVRAASELLNLAESVNEAKNALLFLARYFEAMNLNWTLYTVIRKYPDLVAQSLKDNSGRKIYYYPVGNRKQEIQSKENLEKLQKMKEQIIQKLAKEGSIKSLSKDVDE